MISMVKKLLEHVMKKNCKKKINKGLGKKKSLKKENKLYVKGKGYDSSLNLL